MLTLDDESRFDTYPCTEVDDHTASLGHEATPMMVNGLIEPITR